MRWLSGLFLLVLSFSTAAIAADTYLVLPFFNPGKIQNVNWMGESLALELSETLASKGFLVVDRETMNETLDRLNVRRYAVLTRGSVMELAVNADATSVIYGDFEMKPAEGGKNQILVRVRAANARELRRGIEFEESGPVETLSHIQKLMAWRVLNALAPQLAGTREDYLQKNNPVRLDALESYVRGLLSPNFEQKHRLLARAALLEPRYSEPPFQMGKLNYGRGIHGAAAEWFKKVGPESSHFREAQFFLGLSLVEIGKYADARTAFQRVLDDVPLAEVYNNLGAAQLHLGDPKALDSFMKAVEGDPADADYRFNTGYALWKSGQFDQAATQFRASLERKPNDSTATLLLGRCLNKSGPRPGDLRLEGLERLKKSYSETAWLHLKAVLGPAKE